MNIRNISLARTKLLTATTFMLLLSVAQSDETRLPGNYLSGNDRPDTGFNLGYSSEFIDINESGLAGKTHASIALSSADEFGEISLVEMRGGDSTSMHFNFRSYITNELLSATLVTRGTPRITGNPDVSDADTLRAETSDAMSNGAEYSLTFNLPSGQVLLQNDSMSIITPTGFSQLPLTMNQDPDFSNGNFSTLLNEVLHGTDLPGFNMSMSESFAESDLLLQSLADENYIKGSDQHTDGMWACGGALTVLAAANAALAAAIAATYATAGVAAATIAAAVSAVGAAITMVDQYCMQM